MPSPSGQKLTDVRLSKKGLKSPSQKGKVQGGFGDTKKVVILSTLGLVAVGVIAYQFLGGSGPAPAKAKAVTPKVTPPPAGASAMQAEVQSALKAAGDAASKHKGENGLSVERVESLVRKFDTYVEERQIPLTDLRVNPFEVVPTAHAETNVDGRTQSEVNAEAEAEARRQRILQAAGQLKLGAVLIASTTRTAVIGGRLYRVGDVVEGMRVAAIERDHVTLAYETETVSLRLRPGL